MRFSGAAKKYPVACFQRFPDLNPIATPYFAGMRYHALAADYDGTLAHDGIVNEPALDALIRLCETGRRLILVTGRELDHLLSLFPRPELFDRIVAENGAVLYTPQTKEIRTLSEPPPREFAEELRRRGATAMSVGKVIVATWEPHESTALAVIHDMGLELQVIFNKGAVMVLPSGVNKATGLCAALEDLKLSPHNVVGVGDAENDHAFLACCECAVAVANALPSLIERADWTCKNPRGEGVAELIDLIISDDLQSLAPRLHRHHLVIGDDDKESAVDVEPYGRNLMVCGSSGSGKSTLTAGLLERFVKSGYQFLIIDPEGDYDELEFAATLGGADNPPTVDEVLEVLHRPADNATMNLLGISVDHRPEFFNDLLPRLLEMRSRTGRPHWIVVDEAHHLLPTAWKPSERTLPAKTHNMLYITVHPQTVSPDIMQTINTLLVVGEHPKETVNDFCDALGVRCPKLPKVDKLLRGDAIFWRRDEKHARLVHMHPAKSERKRHFRKYAEGVLAPERSFYFRGPHDKLNLRAHNLSLFLQMADGVDDETWEFHLRHNDYSYWLGEAVMRDRELAEEVKAIEQDETLDPLQSRAAIRESIEKRYTLTADQPSGSWVDVPGR